MLILALVLSVVCRWAVGKWPWAYLPLSSVQDKAHDQAQQQARAVLGVSAGASRAEITDAHRNLTAMVHPDRGGTNAAMQEANAARDLLLGDLPHVPVIPSDQDVPPTSRD
ncbi:J domain-containing protein [Erythrobacter sp. R86502]|uniref:J domain-containing protein n=1 Tax=Erythrobacter sp. R86502 TaxID=3093846 RepID=UPI0036D2B731